MGEVGNTIAEDPPAQKKKQNGELNGNHAVDVEQEMEIDENNSTAATGGAQVEVKKISLDADSNEPAVVPIARETNGKNSKNDSDVMEIDDNGSCTETDPLGHTDEVNISGDGHASDQDITMNSEKEVLTLPKENRNRSNISESAVVLSDSSDEDEDGTSTSSSKYRSAERSAVASENEGGFSNGPTSTNQSRMNEDDDDDKPVSIHSDSDDEKDCIMIPDEKSAKIMPSNLSMKATISSMSNSSQMMNNRKPTHQVMTDFDDDIEEIIEDPLDSENMSTAKRLKLSGTSITSVDLSSRPSSSSSASSAYPVNLSTKSNTGNSQALNLSTSKSSNSSLLNPFAHSSTSSLSTSGTSLLPNLTDDMFVLEAPSFIVPYIYEKPSGIDLKGIVNELAKTIVHKETEKRSFDEKSSGAESELLNTNQKSTESSDREEKKVKDSSKRSSKRGPANGDESWDEYGTSTDDEASGDEKRTKVLIKESHADIDSIKPHITSSDQIVGESKNDSYFDSPIGKFFMTIGINLVQEHVQADLLRQQKRKREKEGKAPSASTQMAINSLQKSLEISKQNNAPFKHKLKRCDHCAFKTESDLVLSNHYEVPHYKNNIYKCNYCEYEARPVHDILYHVEAIHNMKGRLDKPMSYHQCPNCPFEDNGKSKMVRHEVACAKKFKPENNLSPPLDWEPPAKIPRIKAKHGLVGAATAYQAMAAQQQQRAAAQSQLAANLSALHRNNTTTSNNSSKRGRNQSLPKSQPQQQPQLPQQNSSNLYKNTANAFKNFNPNLLSNNYQLAAATLAAANTQFLQQVVAQKLAMLNPAAAAAAGSNFLSSLTSAAAAAATAQAASASSKSKSSGSTPSISITPLPRTQQQQQQQQPSPNIKPGQSPNSSGQKNQFVICEICDGYIKDLDQLRNHMQWIHKVKIHPKMIYNRPPLNCQKCQYRFFTDQGLERHLLGSHGLVTSSMQEAANNGKDSGRCPVCGKVFQWKLLNHVSRDHNMTLKPAHLSYKCTVCTATFGMYKLFENHVYSAHSTVAKKDNNKNKSSTSTASSSSSSNSLLKPLRINDEITIIPQPAKKLNDMESHVID